MLSCDRRINSACDAAGLAEPTDSLNDSQCCEGAESSQSSRSFLID